MTFFSEANRDSDTIAASSAATGPRLGFLDSMSASYEAQVRANSMFGLEAAFREAEQEQARAIKKAGGTPPAALNDSEDGTLSGFTGGINSRRYLDAARYFATGEDRDGIGEVLAKRETDLAAVAEKFPTLGLRNYRETFETVQQRAQKAERRWDDSDTSFGGMVGGFLGAAAGAIDPRTDPFNTLTLLVGAVGKTIGQRVASQGFGQGGIEAVNQLTGVQENRSLLGLESGLSRGAMSVAATAIGGAALQGFGEGALALGKRWFQDIPKDPAPAPVPSRVTAPEPAVAVPTSAAGTAPVVEPPKTRVNLMEDFEAFKAAVAEQRNPFGASRRGQAVSAADLDHFTKQLDDWKGPRPWEVPPRAETALPGEVTTSRIDRPFDRAVDALETPDQVARRIDPETFRIYDKLDETANRLRGWLAELDSGRNIKAAESTAALDADILRTEARLAKASAKNQPRLQRELDDLRAARELQFEAVRGIDTPDQATVRKRLQKLDEQMRDLAPLVSRAYGQAEGEWRASGISAESLGVLKDLQSRGSVPFKAEDAPPVVSRPSLVDEMPIMATRADVLATLPAKADAADKIAAVVAAEAKRLDPVIERFRTTIAALKTADDGKLTFPNGRSVSLDKDVIFVPNEDGSGSRQITFRQYLDEIEQGESALKAVGTCSIK